jgi:hypothetical protein
MNKSLVAPYRNGTAPLLLERDVVAPAIQTDSDSLNTVKALSAICEGFLTQSLCPDSTWLALNHAQHIATSMGVPEAEFERVKQVVVKRWTERRAQNPLSKLFD